MRKLDNLILSSFIGPFILTFFITLFVLIMQFLWKYIDDLVGKGLEWHIIAELIFYSSASMVPIALPLAVLLASLMTFGGLGEKRELMAFKAAGISLMRIMRSIVFSAIIISVASFLFANYMLPLANLKFTSLLYDVRQQRPAFNIKPGTFYNGIKGYSIRVGDKDSEGQKIYDIMIYDHTSGRGNDRVLVAEEGEMAMTADNTFLVLRLYNGKEYQEMSKKGKERGNYEHIQHEFKKWEKAFDLSDFSLSRTDEKFFKDHYQMLNLRQLENAIDTIHADIKESKERTIKILKPYFANQRLELDSLIHAAAPEVDKNVQSVIETFPKEEHSPILKRSESLARNVKSHFFVAERDIEHHNRYLTRHKIEWHRKFTLALSCIILFFIGAPLGAIIRKGGLGLPMVVSIVFFIIFYVLNILGEKFAKEHIISAAAGMWMPLIVLLPVGFFLTYKAMHDSVIFNADWYLRLISKYLLKKFRDG